MFTYGQLGVQIPPVKKSENTLQFISKDELINVIKLYSSNTEKYSKIFGLPNTWDVSQITDMSSLFINSQFNDDISNWDVSNVTNMNNMFSYSKFNGDISKWNVSNVNDMIYMFSHSQFNNDISKWSATIIGPEDTPYAGGIFKFNIIFPPTYPINPPQIEVKTKIFHCNFSGSSICLDILKYNWSPALSISKVLISICSLLNDPNPSSALNGEAASLYLSTLSAYT
jgi:ubiquitin-conjugating enzyme E2 D/E